jgi:DNA-binding transcriptional regulator YdaS (Cro superfamily)
MIDLLDNWIRRAGGRAAVAAALGVSVGAVGHWCRGIRRPAWRHMYELAQIVQASSVEWQHMQRCLAQREAA